MTPPVACDPLADARAEMVALLVTLGVAEPLDKLRPVFARVRQRWAGERAHIAHLDPNDRAERDRAILEDIKAGVPVPTIAKRAGVHPATVWRRKELVI